MRMAAITLEKDLLRKVSRLGLDITKTSRISAFSNEGIVSVVNFLLGRYDPSWFWETCNYSLDENRRQCIRFLRLLDIAHLVNGPSELTPRNKRILRLLCALFEKLERKHGSALYQKPRQVLKPRPRRSTEKSQDNAGDKTQRATQTGKENDVDGGGSSLRTVGQGMRTPGRKERQADSQVNVAVPRSPPQTPQTPRRTVAESTEQLPTGPSRIQQATIGSSGSSRPVSGFATAATASPGSAAPAAEQSVTPTVSTANIAIAASAARSPMISQHIHSATGDGGRVTGTAGAAPAAVMHPSPAIRMAVPLLPSTALMKSLQVQIDELQKNISRTSQQQEELRTQQSRLSGNLQKMWAHYEFNLKLLRDLSSSNTGPTANITRLSSGRPRLSTGSPPPSAPVLPSSGHSSGSVSRRCNESLCHRAVSVERLDNTPQRQQGEESSHGNGTPHQIAALTSGTPGVVNTPSSSEAVLLGAPLKPPESSSQVGSGDCSPVWASAVSAQPASDQSLGSSVSVRRRRAVNSPRSDAAHLPDTGLPVAMRPLHSGRDHAGALSQSDPGERESALPVHSQANCEYFERRLQRVLRRSELFLERDRLLQSRIAKLQLQ